jgi:hypothetical protein
VGGDTQKIQTSGEENRLSLLLLGYREAMQKASSNRWRSANLRSFSI